MGMTPSCFGFMVLLACIRLSWHAASPKGALRVFQLCMRGFAIGGGLVAWCLACPMHKDFERIVSDGYRLARWTDFGIFGFVGAAGL
jgi:hypothetical protein